MHKRENTGAVPLHTVSNTIPASTMLSLPASSPSKPTLRFGVAATEVTDPRWIEDTPPVDSGALPLALPAADPPLPPPPPPPPTRGPRICRTVCILFTVCLIAAALIYYGLNGPVPSGSARWAPSFLGFGASHSSEIPSDHSLSSHDDGDHVTVSSSRAKESVATKFFASPSLSPSRGAPIAPATASFADLPAKVEWTRGVDTSEIYRVDVMNVDVAAEDSYLQHQVDISAASELAALQRHGLRDGAVVLDMGCGPGWFARALLDALSNVKVICLDGNAELLARAEHHHGSYIRAGRMSMVHVSRYLPPGWSDGGLCFGVMCAYMSLGVISS